MIAEMKTGPDVVAALRAAAAMRGVPVTDFVRPITASPSTWLIKVQQARTPKPLTIERAAALINGLPIPGIGTPGTLDAQVRREVEEWGQRRALARSTGTVVNALASQDRGGELLGGTAAPLDRDPCFRCGVRGDIGCAHRRRSA